MDNTVNSMSRGQSVIPERDETVPLTVVVTTLCALLGRKVVAYIGAQTTTVVVREWAVGASVPTAVVDSRLRAALEACEILLRRYPPIVVNRWFVSENDFSPACPARLLRNGDPETSFAQVHAAARAFQ